MSTIDFNTIIKRNKLLLDFYNDNDWWDNLDKYLVLQKNIIGICNDLITDNSINIIDDSCIIEQNVTLKPPIVLSKGAFIKSGAYLVGPIIVGDDCIIGPNCFINQYTILGKNIACGQGSEIKSSILLDNCKIWHFSYIGDSILGRNVNIAAGVMTAVRRFDNKNIKVRYCGKNINTEKPKFGAIIGDNVQIGIGVKIYPGRIISPNRDIPPGTIVKKNISSKKDKRLQK